MNSNATLTAINAFNPHNGVFLAVENINGKEQLSATPPLNFLSRIVRKVGLSYTNTSMSKVAKFLKDHEKEFLKLNINSMQKDLLKQKLIKYENNHNIQFTFIRKLFGARTGNHISHQDKIDHLIDSSPVKKEEVNTASYTFLGFNIWSKSDEEKQQSIGKILQDCILPIYKSKMPSTCTYQKKEADSQRTTLYMQSFFQKLMPNFGTARAHHGSMHAVRVAMWTQVLLEIYKQYGRDSISNNILVAAGGGFHDTARENEGIDYWDEESGSHFGHFLKNMGVWSSESAAYIQALREKDPHNGQFSTDIQRIVHDADCLDIIRVVGKKFNPKYLCFSNFSNGFFNFFGSSFDKDKFINEARDFISLTENHSLKSSFEHSSTDFYGDLIRLLFKLEEKTPGRFKLITELISQPMDCYKKSMNNTFVSNIAAMI